MAKHHGRVNSLQRPNLTWKGAWTSSDNNLALNDFWLLDVVLQDGVEDDQKRKHFELAEFLAGFVHLLVK